MNGLAQPHHHRVLEVAEEQYKLAIAVRLKVTASEGSVFDYFEAFSFGRHILTHEELELSHEREEEAAWALVHCATYVMAVQLDTVLSDVVQNRFTHREGPIRSAAWISRLIRNAFSHNPFIPTWMTYPECENTLFEVPGIISLNTTGLHGKRLDRMDYGGPLSLLKLSQFVRQDVLGKPPYNNRVETDADAAHPKRSPQEDSGEF